MCAVGPFAFRRQRRVPLCVASQGYTEVERSIAKRDGKKLIDPIPPPGLMDGCDPGFDFFDERVLQGNWRKQARR